MPRWDRATIDDVELEYAVQGAGEPVVLIDNGRPRRRVRAAPGRAGARRPLPAADLSSRRLRGQRPPHRPAQLRAGGGALPRRCCVTSASNGRTSSATPPAAAWPSSWPWTRRARCSRWPCWSRRCWRSRARRAEVRRGLRSTRPPRGRGHGRGGRPLPARGDVRGRLRAGAGGGRPGRGRAGRPRARTPSSPRSCPPCAGGVRAGGGAERAWRPALAVLGGRQRSGHGQPLFGQAGRAAARAVLPDAEPFVLPGATHTGCSP